jgi:hypothetical protein
MVPSGRISLAALTPPIYAEWWQKYSLDDALTDLAYVDADPMSSGIPLRLFQHVDGAMSGVFGATNVPSIAGWSQHRARIDALAGQSMQLRVHVEALAANPYAGVGPRASSATTAT